ncbi:choice-of-anchor A family protein [Chromatocurvus halotolerans]|uniref:Putative secreted protein with PEP-CTERM sorting signal/choice-of-anchor A domain-containing protein n=1 Tax=Chromatocurvus halotolerans TaxID=1132028 RepID=A0A4R2KWD0_9GAMM|nr:choice-of-anchor A family protein [Chromatocurvus halotolerans]TCO77157.1 putative secreted protein with PEP-CTERM sorting signal/choice-of-anchor A domain-containing protein [Chromatocurvus halotolerans]
MMPDLGVAGTFNAFILGDMQGYHSDVEGRLAVGGNLTLEHYAVGMQLSNSRGARDDLVVGGSADFQHGRMYSGNAVIGGTNAIHPENVGFYNGDNPDDASGNARVGALPLNFSAIGDELKAKSSDWGTWQSSGEVSRDDYGNVQFTGAGKKAVFNLELGRLANVSSFLFDMPRYTTAVINVFDQEVNLSNLGFHHMAIAGVDADGKLRSGDNKMPDNDPDVFRHDGSLTNRILFNFVNATKITMSGIGFKGSILAPRADVTAFNGHIDGNFISNSLLRPVNENGALTGDYTLQFNNYRFMDVPAPSTLSAFALGLLLLGFRTRRRCALPA